MGLTQSTPPTTEPVTLAEAKLHLRVDHADEDTLISSLIAAARAWAETLLARQLVTATWQLTLPEFADAIMLPRPPFLAISSIAYTDTAGSAQSLSLGEYVTYLADVSTILVPPYGESWPSTRGFYDDVTIKYTAGYGAASAVPDWAKSAILLTLADLYENRETGIVGTIRTENPAARRLLYPHRVLGGL